MRNQESQLFWQGRYVQIVTIVLERLTGMPTLGGPLGGRDKEHLRGMWEERDHEKGADVLPTGLGSLNLSVQGHSRGQENQKRVRRCRDMKKPQISSAEKERGMGRRDAFSTHRVAARCSGTHIIRGFSQFTDVALMLHFICLCSESGIWQKCLVLCKGNPPLRLEAP